MSPLTATARHLWETRPPRIPSEQGGNAKIAGVCEGIGVRYQIDPVIVRVLFVVAALTMGGGIAAYLLLWLLMPRYGLRLSPLQAVAQGKDRLSAPERRERGNGWWLLFFFLIYSGILTLGGAGAFASSTVFTLALTGAAWWLLHRRQPQPPAGLLAEPPARTMPEPVNLSSLHPAEGAPYPPGRPTPPAWDPLGTAPFAWDLPDPGTPVATPRRKAKIWPWVLLGMGSAFTLLTGLLTAVLLPFLAANYDGGAVGDLHHSPTSGAQLRSSYGNGVGDLELDLRGLAPLENDAHVTVRGGIGDVEVWLPADVPLDLTCSSGIGNLTCTPGAHNGGAEGETLTLHVIGGIGDVQVHLPTASSPAE